MGTGGRRKARRRDSVPHYATLSQCPIYASCRVRVASTLTDKRSKPWGAVSREKVVGGARQRGRQLADDMDARLICISSLSLSLSSSDAGSLPSLNSIFVFFFVTFFVFVLFSAFALFVWLCLPFIYFAFHANSRIFVYSIAQRCPLLLSAASSTLAMQKFSCSTPAFLKILDTSCRRRFGQLPHYSIPCLILTDLWVI